MYNRINAYQDVIYLKWSLKNLKENSRFLIKNRGTYNSLSYLETIKVPEINSERSEPDVLRTREGKIFAAATFIRYLVESKYIDPQGGLQKLFDSFFDICEEFDINAIREEKDVTVFGNLSEQRKYLNNVLARLNALKIEIQSSI